MIATPKHPTLEGFADCGHCHRRLVKLPTFGWLHLHVKIREHPRYCR